MPLPEKKISNNINEEPLLREPAANYEKAELDVLRQSLKLSHTQRFQILMRLIKVGAMLKNAKVEHRVG